MGMGPMNFSGPQNQKYYNFQLKKQVGQSPFAQGGQYDIYYSNAGGGQAALDAGLKSGVPADPVSAVADSLGALFGFLKSGTDKKIAQEQTRQALINNLSAKETARNIPAQQGGISAGAVIGIGLGLAGLITLTVLAVIKFRKK